MNSNVGSIASASPLVADAAPMIDPFRAGGRFTLRVVGHGPLRFPLHLLHGGTHDIPAEEGPSDAGRAGPALCTAFIAKGVREGCRRLTGGEPLVRKNIMHPRPRDLATFADQAPASEELTLTTNGSQLARPCGGARRTLRRAPHQRLARASLDADKVPQGHHPLGRSWPR